MEYAQFHAGERRTYSEMRQKPVPHNAFFSLIADSPQKRPVSVATDIVDTDWDEEDNGQDDIIYDDLIISDEDISPRASIRSADQTTLSSFEDEIRTPRSSNGDQFEETITGPSGPHLFRSSTDSTRLHATDYETVLSLSPLTPKPRGYEEIVIRPPLPESAPNFRYSNAKLNKANLLEWTPEMVAQWMLNAGIGQRWVDRLIENDINGEILLNLKSEDLRELDIPSLGVRMKLWGQIESLKAPPPESSPPTTPIDERPSREVKREAKRLKSPTGRRQPSIRRQQRQGSASDAIMPSESVSIIGIEQVIPKPHHCTKGKDCKNWKRQQDLIAKFQRENPHINMNASGTVLVAGNTENPETARALDLSEIRRPFSDTIQSEVASSDVLGPGGVPPLQYLREATLRNLQLHDPQDNVQQFLNFQQRSLFASDEVPPTPPFEVLPSNQPPHKGLRRLAKLSIPLKQQAQLHGMRHGRSLSESEVSQREQEEAFTTDQPLCEPQYMERQSPEWETSGNAYRFGTPFSEMDVPVTSVPVGPIARDASQSVPPNMNFRGMDNGTNNFRPRSSSRASSRRPSFPVLPVVNEHKIPQSYSQTPSPHKTSPRPSISSETTARSLQAPPRGQYAWSSDKIEQVVRPGADVAFATPGAANGISFQGPMKKRKTRLLRHEWQDGYFTLKGTRLNMHKDQAALDRALEYIDIDDYAIACSSVASTSKLSAAFKAVSISSHGRDKSDAVGAFSFQLVPQDKNTARLRKRESAVPSCIPPEGVNGTGKTHHFAVKNRDDRIDWMREMMLAKALKQKGAGFEISVNGNMI